MHAHGFGDVPDLAAGVHQPLASTHTGDLLGNMNAFNLVDTHPAFTPVIFPPVPDFVSPAAFGLSPNPPFDATSFTSDNGS